MLPLPPRIYPPSCGRTRSIDGTLWSLFHLGRRCVPLLTHNPRTNDGRSSPFPIIFNYFFTTVGGLAKLGVVLRRQWICLGEVTMCGAAADSDRSPHK